jgi:hypothetical protein
MRVDYMKHKEESAFWILAAGSFAPATALAEEGVTAAAGGYGASDYVWFTVIAVILLYGTYDTFFKTP